jgi:hypothetical protein
MKVLLVIVLLLHYISAPADVMDTLFITVPADIAGDVDP